MDHQQFSVSLTAASSYKLGDPVLVSFTIHNTGSDAVQILDWGTPLEGRFTVDWLIVKRDGVVIPYDGMLVKRDDRPSSAYVLLQPGEQVTKSLDITEAYALDQTETYEVSLNATFFDAFAVPADVKQPPRRRQHHQPHRLPPAHVTFPILEGTAPKLTAGQAARGVLSQSPI